MERWPMERWPLYPCGRGKTADRVRLVVVCLEHRQELRDRKEIGDPLSQVQQPEASALAADRRIGADDLIVAVAVDVRHVREVEDDLPTALHHEAVDLVLQELVAFAERHLALE